jgi:hypothetical protein
VTQSAPQRPPRDALKVKFGDRFEAQATGWGVAAVPVVLVVAGLTLAKALLF